MPVKHQYQCSRDFIFIYMLEKLGDIWVVLETIVSCIYL